MPAFLKDHARKTYDIDLVTNCDFDIIEKLFRENFNVVIFVKNESSSMLLEDSFSCVVLLDNEKVQIEGIKFNFFDEIKTNLYELDNVTFKGVVPEFIIAEKLSALICELNRPYKHLVDSYSFFITKPFIFDNSLIKKYIELMYEQENVERTKLNFNEFNLLFEVSKNKEFFGPQILTTLNAKLNLPKETMVEEINKWLLDIKNS